MLKIGAKLLFQSKAMLILKTTEERTDELVARVKQLHSYEIPCIVVLPIDLAHIEPFDAYLLTSAGIATIVIAIVGLVASLFVPMAYCHYGCPTGALLEFLRGRGKSDRFCRRDVAAALLVALAAILSWNYQAIHAWMIRGL